MLMGYLDEMSQDLVLSRQERHHRGISSRDPVSQKENGGICSTDSLGEVKVTHAKAYLMLLYDDQVILSGGNSPACQPGYHADATVSPAYEALAGGPCTVRGKAGA